MLAAGGSLRPEGPVAEAMADLWWLMLILGTVVFVLFLALLGGGLLRRDDDTSDEEGPRRSGTWLVAGGVVLPLVVIGVVFAATLQTMRATPAAEADDLVIELVGHQWWWEVRYPDHDIVTANEIHIPVGRQVTFRVTSADVIHSFWVPELGGKLDMLPDHPTTLVLEADQAGEYRGQCAEFCGLQHARMEILMVAESGADFDAWVTDQTEQTEATPADSGRGAEVFEAAGCASCHAAPGEETLGDAPALGDLPDRRSLAAGTLPNTRENAADWIRDPQAIKPGVDMLATQLDDDDLNALLDYLGYAE